MMVYKCQSILYIWNLKQIFNPPVLRENATAVRWRWGHLTGMQGRLWEGTLRKCRSFWAGQGVEGEPSTHMRRVKRSIGWRYKSPGGGKRHPPHNLCRPCLLGLSLQSASSPLVHFSVVLLPFFLLFLTLKVLFIIPIANTFSKTMNLSFCFVYGIFLGFPSGSMVKNLPVMQ